MKSIIRSGLLSVCFSLVFFSGLFAQHTFFESFNSAPDWRFTDPAMADYAPLRAAEVQVSDWRPASEPMPELSLTVFDESPLTAVHQRTDFHPNGSVAWSGKLAGQRFGYAIFSDTDGVLFGKIQTDAGDTYLLRPMPGSSNYQLLHVEADQREDCEKAGSPPMYNEAPEENSGSQRVVGVCDAGSICSALTLDLLVVYTPDARTALGGSDAAAQAAIATAVTELNTINGNSNVIHSYALAHSEMISYTESGSLSTDLDRLEVAGDGQLDAAYDLRDYHYADLVILIVDDGGCGIGNVNGNPNVYYSGAAFSISDDVCLTTNKTLSHEVGHNMGFLHDRYAYSSLPSNVCDYAWGWVNPNANGGSQSQRWRTVMAYNDQCADWGFNCTRIPHWSNPDINYNGDPTGSAIGNTDEAHNAYLLDRAACLVQDFRVPNTNCPACNFYQASANYNPNTDSGPGNTTDISLTEPFNLLAPTDPDVEVCVYYHGDHSSGSETFDVVSETGTVLGQTIASNDCEIPTRVCFTVSPVIFNAWITDGTVTISLDPTSSNINPTLCYAYNRASVELLVPVSTLPVEFSRFYLSRDEADILLNWETAWEYNSDYFRVEHSRDGQSFTPVAQISAAGFSNVQQKYQFRFRNAPAGTHYFRIRQTDFDGSSMFTEVRSLEVESASAEFRIYPNPVEGTLFISSPSAGHSPDDIGVEVFDHTGRRISVTVENKGSKQLELSTQNWGAGLFFLRISDRTSGRILDSQTVVVQ